jgi:hypothetical protein
MEDSAAMRAVNRKMSVAFNPKKKGSVGDKCGYSLSAIAVKHAKPLTGKKNHSDTRTVVLRPKTENRPRFNPKKQKMSQLRLKTFVESVLSPCFLRMYYRLLALHMLAPKPWFAITLSI